MKRMIRGLVAMLLFTLTPSSAAKAQTHLAIHSDGDCPSGEAVATALWAIRPDAEWPPLSATLAIADQSVRITLGDDETHRREIAVPDDCTDRANRVALVIAVWSGGLPAHDTRAPSLAVVVAPPTPTPKKASNLVTELGVDGFYAMVGGLAPGARFELSRFQRQGWWGARAVAGYQATKSRQVDIGESRYDRMLLGATLVLRWDRPWFFLSSEGGFLGAFTRASGSGYSLNQSASGFNLAVSADGRVGLRLGTFRLWANLSLYRWARKETFRVDPLSTAAPSFSTLPAWDAHLGLGTSVTFN